MEEVWKTNRERFLAQEAEINRPVPAGWVLGLPSRRKLINPLKEFKSGLGGGVAGPTPAAKEATRGNKKLSDVFSLFVTKEMLQMTARETNGYAVEDWVKPRSTRNAQDDDDDDSVASESEEPKNDRRGMPAATHQLEGTS